MKYRFPAKYLAVTRVRGCSLRRVEVGRPREWHSDRVSQVSHPQLRGSRLRAPWGVPDPRAGQGNADEPGAPRMPEHKLGGRREG